MNCNYFTQLHTFRDFDWPFNHSLEDLEANYATEKVIISPKRQFLLSYLVFTFRHIVFFFVYLIVLNVVYTVHRDVVLSHFEENSKC